MGSEPNALRATVFTWRLHPGCKYLLLTPVLFFLLSTNSAAGDTALLPGDAASGKTLHAAQCTACHDAKVYTRKDRRVRSLGGLIKQVEACNRQLKKELSSDQLNDLVAYLNETYYRFE